METLIFKLFGAHPDYSSLYLDVGVFLTSVIGAEPNVNQNPTPVFSYDIVLYTKDFVDIIPTVENFRSHDIIFDESVFPYKDAQHLSIPAQEPSTITTFSDFTQWTFPSAVAADSTHQIDECRRKHCPHGR